MRNLGVALLMVLLASSAALPAAEAHDELRVDEGPCESDGYSASATVPAVTAHVDVRSSTPTGHCVRVGVEHV